MSRLVSRALDSRARVARSPLQKLLQEMLSGLVLIASDEIRVASDAWATALSRRAGLLFPGVPDWKLLGATA